MPPRKLDKNFWGAYHICGTRCVIIDIQAQCLVKAPQKDKLYLSFWRPSGGL